MQKPAPLGDLLTYADAAAAIDPDGRLGITARSIRSEYDRGRIPRVMIAGKAFIKRADLARLLQSETATPAAPRRRPAAPIAHHPAASMQTQSAAAVVRAQQAAARLIAKPRPSPSAPQLRLISTGKIQ